MSAVEVSTPSSLPRRGNRRKLWDWYVRVFILCWKVLVVYMILTNFIFEIYTYELWHTLVGKISQTKQDIYVKYDIFSEKHKIVVLHHGLWKMRKEGKIRKGKRYEEEMYLVLVVNNFSFIRWSPQTHGRPGQVMWRNLEEEKLEKINCWLRARTDSIPWPQSLGNARFVR